MIIAIESRVPGPTLSSLRSLILRNYELPGFEYLPVSSEKTYQQFLDTPGVTSMEMSMLNIDNAVEKKQAVPGIAESTELVDEANGHKIVIQISSGQKRNNYLNKGYVKKMADWAVSSFGGKHEVSKFKLKIVDLDSGKINPIDLISGRISDTTEIEKVRAINRFSIKEKIGQIEGKYLKRRPYLDNRTDYEIHKPRFMGNILSSHCHVSGCSIHFFFLLFTTIWILMDCRSRG